jgi:protein-tyrosine phosphatase
MFGIRNKLLRLRLAGWAERQHRETLDAIRRSGRPVGKLLFLCYGNICRSPIAEKVAKRLLPEAEVSSAGFYSQEGRSTPDLVQRAAGSLGIDLTDWASRRVTGEMVRRADLVVLMDLYNFRDFRREFPSDQNKIVFLGLLLEPPQLMINDPYGKPLPEILNIITEISKGVTELARRINPGVSDRSRDWS